MTREAHLEAGSRYRECAIRAIASFRETILGGMAQGLTGSADMPCSSRKAIAAAS